MARFYFDLVNGSEVIPDEEGVEARDLSGGVAQAGEVPAEMVQRGEFPDFDGAWRLVVRDSRGLVRHTLDVQ